MHGNFLPCAIHKDQTLEFLKNQWQVSKCPYCRFGLATWVGFQHYLRSCSQSPNLSVTKYIPLQLPTSILVYGRMHSSIVCNYIVKERHSQRPPPPPHHNNAMCGKKFVNAPLKICSSVASKLREATPPVTSHVAALWLLRKHCFSP